MIKYIVATLSILLIKFFFSSCAYYYSVLQIIKVNEIKKISDERFFFSATLFMSIHFWIEKALNKAMYGVQGV